MKFMPEKSTRLKVYIPLYLIIHLDLVLALYTFDPPNECHRRNVSTYTKFSRRSKKKKKLKKYL